MSSVFPGVEEVLASPLCWQSMLMRLDLPTFDRPMKAYSALSSFGHMLTKGADSTKADFLISIISSLFDGCKGREKKHFSLPLPAYNKETKL